MCTSTRTTPTPTTTSATTVTDAPRVPLAGGAGPSRHATTQCANIQDVNTGRVRQSSPECTRLAVLGLLARHGPQHGYQLRKLIEAQNIDRFSNVQLGSIYATLNRLARDGLIEVGPTSKTEGRGPARTVHSITALGRSALDELLAASFVDVEQPERAVDLALHFSSLLDVDTVLDLLERRLRALEAQARGIEKLVVRTTHPDQGVQQLVRDIGEHFAAANRAEAEWTTTVLRCARDGGYRVRPSGETT